VKHIIAIGCVGIRKEKSENSKGNARDKMIRNGDIIS